MKIAILGGTGGTGREAITQARHRGHDVVALARHAQPAQDGVRWIVGDATDRAVLAQLVTGTDGVFCALGPRDDSPDACSRATAALVSVLDASGPRRLVVVTGAMIGHPRKRLGLLYRAIRRSFEQHQPQQAKDRHAQEDVVEGSALAWTILRPARLVDGPRSRHVRVGTDLRVGALAKTRRADLATVALDELERGEHLREGAVVLSR